MAEITKVTTPMIPRENLGTKKPISDQAFELTDPSKVHKTGQDASKILDHQRDGQAALRDAVGREMFAPILKSANDLMQAFQKMTVLLQMGISTSEIVNNAEIRELLDSIFYQPEQLAQALQEQDGSAVLFKGATFDLLRDILARFPDSPKVRNAVTHLIKTFEQNVNAENSVKTILLTCQNLLDYMFSGDKAQFSKYLEGLMEMLLPEPEAEAAPQNQDAGQRPTDSPPAEKGAQNQAQIAGDKGAPATPGKTADTLPGKPAEALPESTAPLPEATSAGKAAEATPPEQQPPQVPISDGDGKAQLSQATVPDGDGKAQPSQVLQERSLGVEQREAAQILKGNLLPLLGEIVVKYNQNGRIRDMVMVVVHNIVRVDQGTPEKLEDAIAKLVHELRLVANLPKNFESQLQDALMAAKDQVKDAGNATMSKLAGVIAETLSSPTANAATLRQAENLLLSLLQNQSSMMNVLHFMLPMETEQGRMFAEMYVDPDSDEHVGRSQERSRKIFLAFESDSLGAFELSFLESAERVDFSLWCPDRLVGNLSAIKRQIGDIMQIHGYTMNSYSVAELVTPKSIADVFPKLLQRRLGVDVRI